MRLAGALGRMLTELHSYNKLIF
ncbi:hypothetical protein BOSE127_140385 [Bosea sp. 127]|nr:hypothetical protein BOSE127_140385 [Bosea sp. 127]